MEQMRAFFAPVLAGTDTVVVPEADGVVGGRTRTTNSTAIINTAMISNTDGEQNVLVNITIFDGTNTTIIGQNIPIPAGATLVLDKPITLEPLDRFRVFTAHSNDVSVHCSVIEVT